jgi:hypothetical protein
MKANRLSARKASMRYGIAKFAGKSKFAAGEDVVGPIERKSMVRGKYA